MKKALLIAMAFILSIFMVACDKASASNQTIKSDENKNDNKVNINSLLIENMSPDLALKTWWRFLDAKKKLNAELCQKNKTEQQKAFGELLPKIVQYDLLERLSNFNDCQAKKIYQREIQEVNTESDTRVVVFAVIKNTTPIPSGAVPNKYDAERRNNGFKYKYVLEKNETNWKIAEVYIHDEYEKKNGGWKKVYKEINKHYISSLVYQQ